MLALSLLFPFWEANIRERQEVKLLCTNPSIQKYETFRTLDIHLLQSLNNVTLYLWLYISYNIFCLQRDCTALLVFNDGYQVNCVIFQHYHQMFKQNGIQMSTNRQQWHLKNHNGNHHLFWYTEFHNEERRVYKQICTNLSIPTCL